MTDENPDRDESPADGDDAGSGDAPRRRHEYSSGQGFDDPYDEFDLDPPELDVDPDKVDPVDSRVVTDMLDERNTQVEDVDVHELIDVGLNYISINRYEQATETFERAAQYADETALEQEARVNQGAAHAELEEWDAAVGAYQEALALDEDSEHAASAETNLAYALWESGDVSRALEHAERAVEIDERFAQGWYNRGFFLAERGLNEDALHAFDNALRLGFRNSEILEEKARVLEELGEDERAEAVAEEAEEIRERAEGEMVEEHAGGGPITELHGEDPRPADHQRGGGDGGRPGGTSGRREDGQDGRRGPGSGGGPR